MLSRRPIFLLLILSAGWLSGCRAPGIVLSHGAADHSSEGVESVEGVEVTPVGRLLERGQIVPDVSAVIPSESDITPPEKTLLHRVLTAAECKCAAADHASVANLIDLENGIAGLCSSTRIASKQQAAALQSELMAYRSASERNKAAGEALELFFLLAEVEFGRDALAQSLVEVDKIRDYMVQIRESGLDLDIAESAVYNRRGELLDQKAKLALEWSRLNGELRCRLGLCVDDQTPIWPESPLKVEVAQIDVDTAIAEGLAMRPDVAAIQRLTECLDTNSMAHARSTLQAVDAVLGSSTGKGCLKRALLKSTKNCEWANRSEQLDQLLVHLQRDVAEEIRQAVFTVEARIQQVAIAKQRLVNRQQTLDDLRLQWGGPDVTAFQISDAKLKLLRAQTDLVHQVVAWEIARVKLKQAQGLFALECGYTQPGHGYVPAEEPTPSSNDDADANGDVAPPPKPPFAEEEPALLRQPESVTGSETADVQAAPDSSTIADDPSQSRLQQPEGVVESAVSDGQGPPRNNLPDGPDGQTADPPAEGGSPRETEDGQEAPTPASPKPSSEGPALSNEADKVPVAPNAADASPPAGDEALEPPVTTTTFPEAELRLPPDMVFGEKISAAEKGDPTITSDVSQHVPQAPQRIDSVLQQPSSLISAGSQRRITAVAECDAVEKVPAAPRAVVPNQAASLPELNARGLRQPQSIASVVGPSREDGESGSRREITGLAASPAEELADDRVESQPAPSAIRQPDSVASAGREPHISRSVTSPINPNRKPVLPVSIAKERLTTPAADRPTLRQPESVVGTGKHPRVGGPEHRVSDRRDAQRLASEHVAKAGQSSPSDRVALRQPMSFSSVEIRPDEPGVIVRRVCDRCQSTAEDSSLDQTAALAPSHAALQQPFSFASAFAEEEPEVAAAEADRSYDEGDLAPDTSQNSSGYAVSTLHRCAYPPRFVSNAHRHLQPPRISGGCRSGRCQQVQCQQGH